jgi:DNA ligase-associated metallophosphoesterase
LKISAAPHSTFAVDEDVLLDARRALFVRSTRTLALADLHLGYAWAHRHAGQLLPVSAQEDSLERITNLIDSHDAREVVLLGDIVHRAVAVEALKAELCKIISTLSERLHLVLVAGNHDRHLQKLLVGCGLSTKISTEFLAGRHLFVHGDTSSDVIANRQAVAARGGRVIIGHEHPAITISDGVATRVKCPCFLVGKEIIVLPAFSPWAAGTDVLVYPRMSAWAGGVTFTTAFAIVNGKLLPRPLHAD